MSATEAATHFFEKGREAERTFIVAYLRNIAVIHADSLGKDGVAALECEAGCIEDGKHLAQALTRQEGNRQALEDALAEGEDYDETPDPAKLKTAKGHAR